MKIGFTGTRQGMSKNQTKNLVQFLVSNKNKIKEFHHGDCIGSDTQAHTIAENLGLQIHIHPPINNKYRGNNIGNVIYPKRGYIERNHDIVTCCDILIATPKSEDEEMRSGTWATVRFANKLKKEVYIINP